MIEGFIYKPVTRLTSGIMNSMNKMMITIGMALGSTLGALMPQLWGDKDFLSPMSFGLGLVFGLVGIWVGYKVGKWLS